MKVVIIGCGAMGSIYAALLADAGNEVHAVDASTAHVTAISESGLSVEGASGDRTVRLAASTRIPQSPVDLVVAAVKASHVAGNRLTAAPLAPDAKLFLNHAIRIREQD